MATLTAKARETIPVSVFALPARHSHGRVNALVRVSELTGKVAVRIKTHRRHSVAQ